MLADNPVSLGGSPDAAIKLSKLPSGVRARVVSIDSTNLFSHRLMEMGVVPGVELQIVKSAPFGDPIEVRVRGYSLAIRRSEAEAVEVVV